MDARLDRSKYAGLAEGDAHVIRNAGDRASDDAIRSLVISYKLLEHSLETSSIDGSGWHDSENGPGSTEGKFINWLTISDLKKSVVEDVERIRNNPMVPSGMPNYEHIYDCQTGRLVEVPEATQAGGSG